MFVVYHAFFFSNNPPQGWASKLSSYGFAGVNLFFVLSGFLITGILLGAKGKAHYFRNFYAKRALRIWPLYYLLLLLTFGFVPILVTYAHLHMAQFDLLKSQSKLAYIFLLQNLWYARGATTGPLGMTWSLAIEEQFYLVWPWLVLWCNRTTLVRITGFILFLSPIARLLAKQHGVGGQAIYFATWFQLDGLSLGALIAVYCQSGSFSLSRLKWMAVAALAVGLPASVWLQGGHSKDLWPLWHSVLALTKGGAQCHSQSGVADPNQSSVPHSEQIPCAMWGKLAIVFTSFISPSTSLSAVNWRKNTSALAPEPLFSSWYSALLSALLLPACLGTCSNREC